MSYQGDEARAAISRLEIEVNRLQIENKSLREKKSRVVLLGGPRDLETVNLTEEQLLHKLVRVPVVAPEAVTTWDGYPLEGGPQFTFANYDLVPIRVSYNSVTTWVGVYRP